MNSSFLRIRERGSNVYKGQRFTGQVESDGSISFDGERFDTLSAAAAKARAKALKASSYQNTNGWCSGSTGMKRATSNR